MAQNVPEWYADTSSTADVAWSPVPPTQKLDSDPVAILVLDGYATEVLAGIGNIELLVSEDGEVPDEYWYENLDPYGVETKDDVEKAIAEQVDEIKAFIARVERVGPTPYGRDVITNLQESISDSNIEEARVYMMEYVEDPDAEPVIECNGWFDRIKGTIDHSLDCPVHGKTIEF